MHWNNELQLNSVQDMLIINSHNSVHNCLISKIITITQLKIDFLSFCE